MTDIVHQLIRFMATQLKSLELWSDVFAVCFVSQDGDAKQVELYKYIDAPNPDPLVVGPSDNMGTYIYIREMEDGISGQSSTLDDDSSCNNSVTIKKRFRAVAISPDICFPVELATRLSFNVQDVDFSTFTRYTVQDVSIEFVNEIAGIKTLYEIETGTKPKSDDIQMAAIDFDLVFNYDTTCSDDPLPEIC